LIKIKSEREIDIVRENKKYDHDKFVSKQFSNPFSSYTQAFNKQQRRMGSLFMKNFKRKKVADDIYFKNLVYYIHYNPVEAGLSEGLEDYKHSSYNAIITGNRVFTLREEVLSFFDGPDSFISFHKAPENFGKLGTEGLW
jgi:putative transposase